MAALRVSRPPKMYLVNSLASGHCRAGLSVADRLAAIILVAFLNTLSKHGDKTVVLDSWSRDGQHEQRNGYTEFHLL